MSRDPEIDINWRVPASSHGTNWPWSCIGSRVAPATLVGCPDFPKLLIILWFGFTVFGRVLIVVTVAELAASLLLLFVVWADGRHVSVTIRIVRRQDSLCRLLTVKTSFDAALVREDPEFRTHEAITIERLNSIQVSWEF
jgi:hypothetical protein